MGEVNKSNHSGSSIGRDTFQCLQVEATKEPHWPALPLPVNDNKWRRIGFQSGIFMLTFVNYGVLHATRSSWSLATKDLLNLYDWSEGTVSDMNATFLFTYSLGGFFLSHLGDIYSKRKLICFMYTLIALVEVALGCLQFVDTAE